MNIMILTFHFIHSSLLTTNNVKWMNAEILILKLYFPCNFLWNMTDYFIVIFWSYFNILINISDSTNAIHNEKESQHLSFWIS